MRRDAMDLYIAASTNCTKQRIGYRRLLSLLRAFLRARVMEAGTVRRPVTGTAHGGGGAHTGPTCAKPTIRW